MTAPAPPLASGTRTTSGRPSPFLLSSLDVQVPVAGVRKDPGRGHGEGLEGGSIFLPAAFLESTLYFLIIRKCSNFD